MVSGEGFLQPPTEEQWAEMRHPDGRIDSVKLMTWIQKQTRRRLKEIAAAMGDYSALYFPWHDGTERLGE